MIRLRTLIAAAALALLAAPAAAQQAAVINSLEYSDELVKYAEQGNAQAQNNLGIVYLKGSGTDADPAKAVYWFQKAADAGNVNAKVNLGAAYLKGNGVEQDFAMAAKYFEEAAGYENQGALFNLGLLYSEGLGVEKNPEKAFELVKKAADLDFKEHSKVFDEEQIGNTNNEATTGTAQMYVAVWYRQGFGTAPDMEECMKYIKRAADNSIPRACLIMADASDKGEGVEKNPSAAERYYRMAARKGEPVAQYILGRRYATGEVFGQNAEEAVEYLKMVVKPGAKVPDDVRADALTRLAGLLEATDPDTAELYRTEAEILPEPDPDKIKAFMNGD